MSLEVWISFIYNWVVTLASRMSKRYFWYFSKYSHRKSITIRHGCNWNKFPNINLRNFWWSLWIDTDKNASFRSIDVIHIWLNEVNDIMDGFHLKVLIVDKLINFFRLQYHSFIAIFLVPSKNSRNKFTIIWRTPNNN